MTSSLPPCPFCGGPGSIFPAGRHPTAFEGGCQDDECAGFETIWALTEEEARTKWGRRAPIPDSLASRLALAMLHAEVLPDCKLRDYLEMPDEGDARALGVTFTNGTGYNRLSYHLNDEVDDAKMELLLRALVTADRKLASAKE
ncbi:hypothetical protein [Salipiger sp. PrR003]|uniref:hypothetical protein n=1 Tax=Salipiger sp. PrR003 TaxID=2706776 RepID=UPI0013DCB729|nr:hypothetical protein [Salipiger sp. PrR003]NDV52741.1 hypothetical protein [Salipiger sp. PrR003]